jgi:hypothetical protein
MELWFDYGAQTIGKAIAFWECYGEITILTSDY